MADYNSFKNEWTGRRIDYDRVYAYQCVDEILQFAYEVLGCTGIVRGNAIDYWTKPSPALLEKCDRLETTDCEVGDIVVLRTKGAAAGDFSGDGHIGLLDHQDATNVWLLEQNGMGGGDGIGRNAISVWRSIPKSRIAGVLRKKKPVPPAPVLPQPSYSYERLATPLQVQTRYDAQVWDLNYSGGYGNAKSTGLATQGRQFEAVGKATKLDMPEHPVYFMSAESFGSADVTGVPTFNQGINTVDLEPVPAPAPVIEAVAPVVASELEVVAAPEAPVVESPVDGDIIPVNVIAPNPEAWKATFKTNCQGEYRALASTIIHDLDKKADDTQLVKGQLVHVAGDFIGPDFIHYYRTVKSVENNNWRGIPYESLDDDDSIFTFKDDLIDDFRELRGQVTKRKKVIIATAKAHGEFNWLADRLKKKDKTS